MPLPAITVPDCATACSTQPAELLNSNCFCVGLEADALDAALQADDGSTGVAALIAERCPHLFAAQAVFVSTHQAERMAELISAIESVIALPAYRAAVLADAPPIARHDPGALGVFYGYDFHLAGSEVGLIEINTNAGGVMINAAMARAGKPCIALGEEPVSGAESAEALERALVEMFRQEWTLGGGTGPLRRIAIVDVNPTEQYLYPEFLLFRQLFQRHGIAAVIADPAALRWASGRLWHGQDEIDLVYNRLTDFLLDDPSSAALRAAYLARAVVMTPHPQAHALYADKRNLVLLTDPARLQALGVPAATQAVLLRGIPRTEMVTADQAERLWATRRGWFFKPAAGYGGRAAYRGDKLTKRAWQDILDGDYVAQAVMAPSERMVGSAGAAEKLKFDIRNYCYEGRVQWTAARVYQGQTTNFRTPGGGFAAVYRI
jgi:hypothetical protein